MGESYKGLTIKIGADTGKLESALRGVNGSLTTTQNYLTRIKRGLKFDPSSIALLTARVDTLGDRMQSSARKVDKLEAALREVANGSPHVERLSRDTNNLSEKARQASVEFAKIVEEEAAINSQTKQIAKSYKGCSEALDAFLKANDYDGMRNELLSLDRVTEEHQSTIKRLTSEYKRLNAAQLRYESADGKSGILIDLQNAERIKDLRLEINATKAATKSLADEFISARTALGHISGNKAMDDLRDDTKRAERSMESLEEEAQRLKTAIEYNPSSIEAMALAIRNSKEQTVELKNKLKSLEERAGSLRLAGAFSDASVKGETLSGMIEKAADSLKEMKAESAAAGNSLNKANERLRELLNSKSGFSSESLEELQREAAVAQKRFDMLKKAEEEAEREYNSALACKELRELESQIVETKAKMKSLKTSLGSDFMGGMNFAFRQMRSMSAALSTVVTPAAMMAGYNIVSSAEEIDSAYRDMRKTVNGTEAQFRQLKEAAMEFASTSVVSADEILSIEAMGGQLGVSVENLEEFATTVSNLDIATNIDAEEAAIDLGKLSGILTDLTEDKFSRFGDALVRLGNNSPALESDIINITTRMGGMGSIVGMSSDQILAWATAASTTGVKAEAAGTAMQKTMSNIEAAVADGGEKLEGFAKVAGMTADDFAAKWNNDASGALQAFVEGLARLDENSESVDQTLVALGITGSRQKQLLEGLALNTDTLSDALTMSKDAWNGVSDQWGFAGDAAAEAEKKTAGFSGSVGVLRNNIQNAGSVVGESLVPYMDKLSEVVGDAVKWFNNLSDADKEMVIQTAALVVAAGPLVNVFSALGGTVTSFYKANENGVRKIDKARAKLLSFRGAIISAFGSPTKMAVSGLTVLLLATAAAAYSAYKKAKQFENIQSSVDKAVAGTSETIEEQSDALKKLGQFLGIIPDRLDEIEKSQLQLADEISDTNKELGTNVKELDNYSDVIEKYGDKTDRSAVETAKLQTALDEVNETCGSSLAIDELTGKVVDLSKSSVITSDEIRGLGEEFEETASKADAKSFDSYMKTIEELGGKSNLSEDDLNNLKAAVEGVNGYLNTNFSIDSATGQVINLGDEAEITSEKLKDVIENAKLAMQAQAYSELSGEATKKAAERQYGIEDIKSQIAELEGSGDGYYLKVDVDPRTGQVIGKTLEQTNELKDLYSQLQAEEAGLASDQRAAEHYSDLATTATSSCETIASATGLTTEKVRGAFEKQGISFSEFNEKILEAGLSTEDFADINRETWHKLLEDSDGSADALVENLQKVIKEMDKGKEEAGKAGSETGSEYADGFDEASQRVNDTAYKVTNGMVGKLNSGIKGAAESGRLFGSEYSSGVGSASAAASSASSLLGASAINTLAPFVAKAGPYGSSLGGHYGEAIADGEGAAIASAETVSGAAISTFDSADASGSGLFLSQGFANGILSGMSAVTEAAASVAQSALDTIASVGGEGSPWSTTTQKGLWAAEGLALGLEEGSGEVEGSAGTLANTIIALVSEQLEGHEDIGARFGSSVAVGISGSSGEVSQAASSYATGISSQKGPVDSAAMMIGESAKAKLVSSATAMKAPGSSGTKNFADGIKSASATATSAAKSVGEASKDAMDVNTYSVGTNFDQGLADGIDANGGVAAAAAERLGERTYQALKRKLEVHSPSKLTERVGGFFDQGFADGIKNDASVAMAAASNMATDTVKSFENAINRQQYETLQMNMNATVSGSMESLKANMVTKEDITSAVRTALDGMDIGTTNIHQTVGNVTYNDDDEIYKVITGFVEKVLDKRGM